MAHRTKRPAIQAKTAAAVSTPLLMPPQWIWASVALAAFAFLLYASSWRYGFAGDDPWVILQNAWTREGVSALPRVVSHSLYFGAVPLNGGLYRPVAGAYYVIVGALVGLRPAGYHIAQLLLYGLNAATMFLFLARVTRRSIALPVVATLLFIVHPVHTEVVNNIKSADEMLCLEFLLTSAIAWLHYADTADARWSYLSFAAYALAVGSKETAVPMMLVLPALWYFFRHRTALDSLRAAIPFAIVALAYVVLRQVLLAREPSANIVTILNNALLATNDRSVQLASALAYLGRYARMLVWPHPLSFDYGYNAIPLHTFRDPAVWISIVFLLGLGAILIRGFRARRSEAFAVIWCAASMIAVSNLLFLISTNFGERLLYLPSLIVCYLAAHLLFIAGRAGEDISLASALRAPAVAAPVALLCALSSVAVVGRTREWKDQITLFGADVKKFPESSRLNSYFGNLLYFEGERLLTDPRYVEVGKTDLINAKAHLMKGLAIIDDFQDVHAALGMAEYHLKECEQAVPHLQRALTFKTQRSAAIQMLAECYEQLHEPDRAAALFKEMDTDGTDTPDAWFHLGNAAAASGDIAASIKYFEKFIAARPDNIAAHFNLAASYRRVGDMAKALTEAERCVSLKPTPTVAASCLMLGADALMQTGHQSEAMEHFGRAKALDPNNPWIRKSP